MSDPQIDQRFKDLERKITQLSNSVSGCALEYQVTPLKRDIAGLERQFSDIQKRLRALESRSTSP